MTDTYLKRIEAQLLLEYLSQDIRDAILTIAEEMQERLREQEERLEELDYLLDRIKQIAEDKRY